MAVGEKGREVVGNVGCGGDFGTLIVWDSWLRLEESIHLFVYNVHYHLGHLALYRMLG